FAARTFRVANLGGKSGDEEAVRAPITFQTLNAVQPNTNALRTFVGTGDRENLLEKGSACRLSNPLGCAAQGCAVRTTLTVERGGSTALTSTASFQDFRYDSGVMNPGAAGPACGGAQVTLTWSNEDENTCLNDNDGAIQYTCDGDANTWSCRETANTWAAINYQRPNPTHPQRYYGFRSFTQVVANRTFDNAAEAVSFDGARLTDGDLTALGGFDPNTGQDTGQPSVDPDSNGWYINYQLPSERTGGSGTIVAGCVLWQSFEPSGAPQAVCSTTGTNVARLYQARFTSGAANCVQGFYDTATDSWARFTSTTTVAAPPEPALQVSIGGGQISTTVNLQGPGTQTTTTINSVTDSVKSLYQLELDRRGHDCRHGGTHCE
ncbi:MAG: pilus assembly protein PilY, partial [Myxococcaceae bacterium]|nr:pilus assembly protein PilY [Myxococcaceae bacterium]